MKKRLHILFSLLLINIFLSFNCFAKAKESKILISYFSKAGEEYDVGLVEKGNIEILAEMIAEETGGKLLKIETVKSYPMAYEETLKVTKEERDNKIYPKLKTKIKNLKNYEIIFLGYPVWWEDLPMPIYTFLNENNLSDKTIIIFSTNEGNGHGGTVDTVAEISKGNVVRAILSIYGAKVHNSRDEVEEFIKYWITALKERTDTGNLRELVK